MGGPMGGCASKSSCSLLIGLWPLAPVQNWRCCSPVVPAANGQTTRSNGPLHRVGGRSTSLGEHWRGTPAVFSTRCLPACAPGAPACPYRPGLRAYLLRGACALDTPPQAGAFH